MSIFALCPASHPKYNSSGTHFVHAYHSLQILFGTEVIYNDDNEKP